MPSERLAYLILLQCHQEDLRDCMAMARTICWIPKAHSLARSILASCLTCRKESMKLEKQAMGALPAFKSPSLAPFDACWVDIMGPYSVLAHKRKAPLHKV